MNEGIKILGRAVVYGDSVLKGDITFSSGCVIQPNSTIIAESGPIIFGENCVVKENSTIIFKIPDELEDQKEKILHIGANNVFEVGCTVKALTIGERNVFERKCYVSENVEVSSGCVIGASILEGDITFSSGCVIQRHSTIIAESGPIIFGENCVFKENSTIIFKIPDELEDQKEKILHIGANNVFEVGCTVKALSIGERNVFEPKCYVSENVEVSSGCVIGANILKGDITFSSGCVIEPNSTIIAESGPIIFGENCVVKENSTIIFKIPDELEDQKEKILHIGANNVFEVGCTVKALTIGERNVFERKCYVSENVEVSSGCVIGAGCRLEGKYKFGENTVFYGKNCMMRENPETQKSQALQIDYLRMMLSNYQQQRK